MGPKRALSFYGGDWNKVRQVVPGGDLTKYYKIWIMVFQILPGRLILTIASWIVGAIYCNGHKLQVITTIINVLNGIQTALCIMAILRFYKLAKPQLSGYGVGRKLILFKIPIALQILQRAVFSGLNSHNDLKATAHISQADWVYGIPNLLAVAEMFVFCFLFIPVFSWRPFFGSRNRTEPEASMVGGVIDVLNVSDIFGGIIFAFNIRSYLRQGNNKFVGYYGDPNLRDMRAGQNNKVIEGQSKQLTSDDG